MAAATSLGSRRACARIKHGLVSARWDSHYTAAKSAFVQDVANRVKTGVA